MVKTWEHGLWDAGWTSWLWYFLTFLYETVSFGQCPPSEQTTVSYDLPQILVDTSIVAGTISLQVSFSSHITPISEVALQFWRVNAATVSSNSISDRCQTPGAHHSKPKGLRMCFPSAAGNIHA